MSEEPTITKVHEDARGEMYSIAIGDRELMLLHSKVGSLRGGHSHDVPESVMVLSGGLVYHKLDGRGREYTVVLLAGDGEEHPAGLVHMGEFMEDSWLIEWKVCKDKHSWTNTNYEPWRERVRANGAG